jgi:reactive intermediate/imine deaminase
VTGDCIKSWTFGPDDNVPSTVAPYAHATAFGPLLFVTGQLPVDPSTGELVAGGIRAQTKRVMANLAEVVERCGWELADAVQARAYLTSMDLYAGFNEAYGEWFPARLPSRTCVAVVGLALGALVEVDLVVAAHETRS